MNDYDKPYTTSSFHVGDNNVVKVCVFCESKTHYSDQCKVISEYEQRIDFLKKNRKCFKCTKGGHQSKNCHVRVRCFTCKGNHHSAVCRKGGKHENTNKKDEKVTLLVSDKQTVLLQTANVLIPRKHDNNCKQTKILLDSCSQQTYVSESLVEALKLKPIREVEMIVKAFGEKGKQMKLKEYEILLKSQTKKKNSITIKALSVPVPNICTPISGQHVSKTVMMHPFLRDLELADDGSNDSSEIDILIGADVYWDIVTGEVKKEESTCLVAVKSIFGWILNGPVTFLDSSTSMCTPSAHVMKIQNYETNVELHEAMSRFWDLDVIGISENETTLHEQVENNVKFVNGRYSTSLPFKEENPDIPKNYNISMKRLNSLHSRLKRNPDVLKKYDDVIQEQIKLGIVEEVSASCEAEESLTYLPHREVIREEKSSTKLRIVFDASAKSRSNSHSLNTALYKGPCLNPQLYDLLLQFRSHRGSPNSRHRKSLFTNSC